MAIFRWSGTKIRSLKQSESSSLLHWFDLSPSAFPFNASRINAIKARRAALDNSLFFDELLALGGVDATQLHPPNDPHHLTLLLEALEDMGWDKLKKDCLVYYLLKHWDDGSERQFAQHRLIPAQFAALSDAYYLLDNGNETVPVRLLYSLKCPSLLPHDPSRSALLLYFVTFASIPTLCPKFCAPSRPFHPLPLPLG
jgi:hypothetical protein